jgi:hypothetical protein
MRDRDAERFVAHYAPQIVKFDLPPRLVYTGPAARDAGALRAWFASHGRQQSFEIRTASRGNPAVFELATATGRSVCCSSPRCALPVIAGRIRVREIDDDEGDRLRRIVRRGTESVVIWRRALGQ